MSSKANVQICVDCGQLRKISGSQRCESNKLFLKIQKSIELTLQALGHPCYMREYHKMRRNLRTKKQFRSNSETLPSNSPDQDSMPVVNPELLNNSEDQEMDQGSNSGSAQEIDPESSREIYPDSSREVYPELIQRIDQMDNESNQEMDSNVLNAMLKEGSSIKIEPNIEYQRSNSQNSVDYGNFNET